MTGFGYSEAFVNKTKFVISIKSVNFKYIDINLNTFSDLTRSEELIIKLIKSMFARGKFDIYIGVDKTTLASRLELNDQLLDEYLKLIKKIQKKDKLIDSEIHIKDIIGLNGMISTKQLREEINFNKDLKKGFQAAINNLKKMRRIEGKNIYAHFIQILNKMNYILKNINKRLPDILKNYQKRIKSKIKDLINTSKYDENRVLMEVAFLSDKMDINEELERLKSHLSQMKKYLDGNKPSGRLMEFLLQEMLREVNTIGSKISDIEVTKDIILLKEYVEQLREQARNVE